jgi:hypothetical protein
MADEPFDGMGAWDRRGFASHTCLSKAANVQHQREQAESLGCSHFVSFRPSRISWRILKSLALAGFLSISFCILAASAASHLSGVSRRESKSSVTLYSRSSAFSQ